jgi:predicted RND superfamily exporter protein
VIARVLARACLRRPGLVLVVGLAIVTAGVALASQLDLQTDLSELLPPDAPSVVALHRLADRVGGTGNVAIALESVDGKPDALRAYIPKLVDALRHRLGGELLSIKYERKNVSDFYRRYAAYYVSLADLEQWTRELAVAVAKQNPGYVALDDDDDLRRVVAEVRASRQAIEPHNDADPTTGLLMTEHGALAAVFVRPAATSLDLSGSGDMLARIQAVVDSTLPPDVRVAGYTGSIPTALTEVDAIRRDIVGTAIIVIIAVGGVVALYFRSLRALILLAGPLAIGAAVALGFAKLYIGHLNAQTAFLGSIIVGTGINYSIILLDRFRATRARTDLAAAIEQAIAETMRATAIAAISTAVAFGVLAAGEVESFHQFGLIGGVGILACWLAAFTVLPASLVLTDRPFAQPRRRPLVAVFVALGRVCERAPVAIVTITVALATAGIAIAIDARDHVVETDLRRLGTESSATSGIEKLDNRLRAMDDRSSTPAVIATASREETAAVCEALDARARTDLHDVLHRCYSINDQLPGDVARRLPVIARLRGLLAQIDASDLEPRDRDDFAELVQIVDEPQPSDRDLPAMLREYFVERDGSVGKLAYVDPNDEHIEANLYRLTDAIRAVPLRSGKVIESSGELVVFADVLRATRRDASRLTLAAAVLVLLVLAAATRRIGSIVRVGGALVAGVAVMVGTAVVLGDKLNFFNFVALPTTFGIGIDYAINIEERMRRSSGEVARALGEVGPAVLLASLTSIFGYASLVTADSRALSSFGSLAILGEVSCVVVAVVVVPAAWALAKARQTT